MIELTTVWLAFISLMITWALTHEPIHNLVTLKYSSRFPDSFIGRSMMGLISGAITVTLAILIATGVSAVFGPVFI